MKQLKNKVFFTILIILTFSVISFILVFHIQNYVEQYHSIQNALHLASNNKKTTGEKMILSKDMEKDKELELNENVKFMDSVIYTILLDSNDSIKDVINHSNEEQSDSEIRNLATEVLESKNLKEEHIGLLYFESYSYLYQKGESLILFDNSKVRKSLVQSFKSSTCLFLLLEIVILMISKLITSWIIKPVKLSFERQKEFIEDASHELKTPLSVIISSSEAFEKNHEQKWMKNIREEAERMNLLITDLLDLSMSEREETQLFSYSNLSKVVELAVLAFEGIAFEKNIKMEYKIEENVFMSMDENQIRQLIEILLDNAVKHSKENETVYTSLYTTNNAIKMQIQNTGDEIPKGEEEKIFERFYRVDKSRSRSENRYGLGLAIAKNIVENHRGKIMASSLSGLTTLEVSFKK